MSRIKQDELFQSLSGFLKGKGIEFKDGAYAQRIQRACGLLGEAINATQRTARKAKNEVDKTLDQLRQSIHEATAPKAGPSAPAAAPATTPPAAPTAAPKPAKPHAKSSTVARRKAKRITKAKKSPTR